MLRRAKQTKRQIIESLNKKLLKEYNFDTVKEMVDYVLDTHKGSKIIEQNSGQIIVDLGGDPRLKANTKIDFNFTEKEITFDIDWALDKTKNIDISLEEFKKWFDRLYMKKDI